jgi:hypothetical protein
MSPAIPSTSPAPKPGREPEQEPGPEPGREQAGEFPVDQRDAVFVYNMTKLLLSHVAALTLTP